MIPFYNSKPGNSQSGYNIGNYSGSKKTNGKSNGKRKIVSTARNRNPYTGRPLTRKEVQSGGRAGILRRGQGSKLVGGNSTWVGHDNRIIAPRQGTNQKVGEKHNQKKKGRSGLLSTAFNYLKKLGSKNRASSIVANKPKTKKRRSRHTRHTQWYDLE